MKATPYAPDPARWAAMKCRAETEEALRDIAHLSALVGWIESARWQLSELVACCNNHPNDQNLAYLRRTGVAIDNWDEVESWALQHVMYMIGSRTGDVTGTLDAVVDQPRDAEEESEAPK